MARTKISEFSSTPANNTDIDSINIAEGCAPSGINDAIRELMAQLKDFQTGAVGDSFNGPIGSSTASTGAFTTLSATGAITSTLATGTAPLVIASTTKVANLNVDLLDGADWASPAALGSTTPAAVSATTLAASGAVTLSGGTANGVAYLNGSKVVTSGSALTFDGTDLATTGGVRLNNSQYYYGKNAAGSAVRLLGINSGNVNYIGAIDSGPTEVNFGAASSITAQYWNISGSEVGRFTSTGLGIGTSSPASKLDIVGVTQWQATAGTVLGKLTYSGGEAAILAPSGLGLQFFTNNAFAAKIDSSGNLGLGVTPSAWDATGSGGPVLQIKRGLLFGADSETRLIHNAYYGTGDFRYIATGVAATNYQQASGQHRFYTAPSGTAGNAITFTQALTLDSSGNLLVGTTSQLYAAAGSRLNVDAGANGGATIKTSGGSAQASVYCFNSATTGDNAFVSFGTEATWTSRGSITYNRAGGLTVYNTTSDYRAKDIYGVITDSGSVIDSVPVYMGKMKGATQERPMFIAHETPDYAHTGEKDAVDADGNPVYQQMDASALIPVMWAEIQSLRKRLADAGL